MDTTAALAVALLAGALTVLAPCALTLLPVVVGGAATGARQARAVRRAVVITASLAASVVVFTLLLKASTVLIDIPVTVWRTVGGGLLIALGLAELLPSTWGRLAIATRLSSASAGGLATAHRQPGLVGALLTGFALGPVFTSCSPLYGYVVVTVLPSEPARGLALLGAYVLGLATVLLSVAILGQRAVRRLRWAADPRSVLRLGLGVLFVVVGALVVTGLMQDVETWVLEHSPVAPWEFGADVGR